MRTPPPDRSCEYCGPPAVPLKAGALRPRSDVGHEHQCPACGKDVLYIPTLDLYFHLDGSGNETCWHAVRTAP